MSARRFLRLSWLPFLAGPLLLPLGAAKSEAPTKERAGHKGKGVDALGDPLPAHARARLGTRRLRSGTAFRASALSPDGKLAVTMGDGGTVRLWDLATGKQVCQ